MAEKFDFETEKYEPYTLPDKASLYEQDLDEVIECASCGRNVVYGDCFTSDAIHNKRGLGYMICPECYEKEWNERIYRRNKREAEMERGERE